MNWIKDMSTTALITITAGQANARDMENEFKLKAGPTSTWRWFAKRIAEVKYQMRFPNTQTIDDLAHFTEVRMRSKPEVVIKVEKWNPATGSKGALDVACLESAIFLMRKGLTQMSVWWLLRWDFL